MGSVDNGNSVLAASTIGALGLTGLSFDRPLLLLLIPLLIVGSLFFFLLWKKRRKDKKSEK